MHHPRPTGSWKRGSWLAGAAWSLIACSGGPQLQKQYQQAIEDAAVRRPAWSIPLWSFGDARIVSVSTFTDDAALDTRTQYNWVAATVEVAARCAGTSDPVLFLEELLGLPPQAAPAAGKRWHVYTFEVSQEALFRPCPGGVDASVAERPRCLAGTALDPTLDPETARFLLQQFWYSHRTPLSDGGAVVFGFPWTGMGWTYNWNPISRDPVGVSEFVVRRGASPLHVRDASPAQFCRSGHGRDHDPPTGRL
jgi:hypothetical protein